MKKESRGPLIVAIALLVLPVLYVGSYLALVVPGGCWLQTKGGGVVASRYRLVGVQEIYWPLQELDEWLRPEAWKWTDFNSAIGGSTDLH